MSISLKIAAATTIVFTKARALADGMVMQKIGSSFRDSYNLTARCFRSKGGHTRSKTTVRVPFSVTVDQSTEVGEIFLTIETSAPSNAPLSKIQELPYLVESLGASAEFQALVNEQSVTFA
jgi:hypothetical protein